VDDPYPAELRAIVEDAIARFERRLTAAAPVLAGQTLAWVRALRADGSPTTYLTGPRAFPILLLPWWLEASLASRPDPALQADLVDAAIAGYLFVRMIDDLMDDDRDVPPAAVPALIVLHTEFQSVFARRFAADHPFWAEFRRASFAAAETASADATLEQVGRAEFERIAARKVAGAMIPIAAVCHAHGRADVLPAWADLVDRLGRWHQMRDDTLDWSRDELHGRTTYVLSEAARRRPGRPAIEWIVEGGLGWAQDELDRRMDDAMAIARSLGSPDLVRYLEGRRADVDGQWAEMAAITAGIRDAAAAAATAAAGGARSRSGRPART
jgi:hypothetical protein